MQPVSNFIYGPVQSRRFGLDIGINLLPANQKLCTFDCIYCQYGFNPPFKTSPVVFPTIDQITDSLNACLQKCQARNLEITHATVSGNGEPTMHPRFPEVTSALLQWRDLNVPALKMAILSNGYRLHQKRIREAFESFDEPIVKLDSAIPGKLKEINRPIKNFSLDRLISAMQKCSNIIVQSMFLKGLNDSPEDLMSWKQAIRVIRPRGVQIYTLDRLPALPSVRSVPQSFLKMIAERTSRELNLPVFSF